MRIIRRGELTEVPWKNGGGMTLVSPAAVLEVDYARPVCSGGAAPAQR